MTTGNRNEIAEIGRLIDREVWIVTAAANGRRSGLTATWVSLASLQPINSTYLIGLAPNHFTAELIDAGGSVGLHLCRADQAAVALNFATGSSRDRDKFSELAIEVGPTGTPLLADCLAWLECLIVARYATGDRNYYWADVVAGRRIINAPPLREQALMAAASESQRAQLLANRDVDTACTFGAAQAWRRANRFNPILHQRKS